LWDFCPVAEMVGFEWSQQPQPKAVSVDYLSRATSSVTGAASKSECRALLDLDEGDTRLRETT